MRSVLLLFAAAVVCFAAGPRAGKYNCYSYGASNRPPLLIASFELDGTGEYVTFKKTGKYSFDAASQMVTWIDGVNKENNYTGKFEVENKTHKIRITPRTVCTNTEK